MPGDCVCSRKHGNRSLKIIRMIFLIWDHSPKTIEVGLAGSPAHRIPFGHYAMHAIRGQKTVVNALPQAVFVEWIAEVQIGVSVFITQRRRGHSQFDRRLKIVEDDSPRTVAASAAPVAFIDDDEVKEIWWKGSEEPSAWFVFCKCLIDCKIHFAALDNFARFNL